MTLPDKPFLSDGSFMGPADLTRVRSARGRRPPKFKRADRESAAAATPTRRSSTDAAAWRPSASGFRLQPTAPAAFPGKAADRGRGAIPSAVAAGSRAA